MCQKVLVIAPESNVSVLVAVEQGIMALCREVGSTVVHSQYSIVVILVAVVVVLLFEVAQETIQITGECSVQW